MSAETTQKTGNVGGRRPLDGVLAGDGAVELEVVMRAHSVCLLELVPI